MQASSIPSRVTIQYEVGRLVISPDSPVLLGQPTRTPDGLFARFPRTGYAARWIGRSSQRDGRQAR